MKNVIIELVLSCQVSLQRDTIFQFSICLIFEQKTFSLTWTQNFNLSQLNKDFDFSIGERKHIFSFSGKINSIKEQFEYVQIEIDFERIEGEGREGLSLIDFYVIRKICCLFWFTCMNERLSSQLITKSWHQTFF